MPLTTEARTVVIDLLTVIRQINEHGVPIGIELCQLMDDVVVIQRGIVVMGYLCLHVVRQPRLTTTDAVGCKERDVPPSCLFRLPLGGGLGIAIAEAHMLS